MLKNFIAQNSDIQNAEHDPLNIYNKIVESEQEKTK
jgi:hypothetical protein